MLQGKRTYHNLVSWLDTKFSNSTLYSCNSNIAMEVGREVFIPNSNTIIKYLRKFNRKSTENMFLYHI